MAVKVAELYETLELDTRKFKKDMSSAKKDTGKFSKMLGGIGTAAVAGAAAAGAALAAVAADGIKQFTGMEKQMSEVFTLLPNASSDAKEKMIDDMQEFKMEMGTTTDETVPALYDAISAGVPEDNVFEFLKTAQKAARGGVTDLNTAVDGLTTVINAYGKEVGDAEDVSDILFTTVKTGKTTMDELGSSLSDVAPIAAAVGVNFEDVGAALATMTAQGVPTTEATTQLRQAMNELSKEGTNAYDVFKDVAGVAFTEFIENGGNLQEAMVLMEQAAEDSNTKVQNLFQNIRGGQAALTLTGSGAETFAENLDEMQDRAGATDDAFNTMMDTSATWQERLGSAIEVVREKVGEELSPTFDKLVKYLVENMPNVIEKIEGLGERLDFVTENISYAKEAIDIFYQALKTYMTAGVDAVIILADSFGIIKDSLDIVVAQIGKGTIGMSLFFAKAIDKILSQARRLEGLPGVGDMFKNIADSSEEAINKMESDQDKLNIKIKKNTLDMEKGFSNLKESVTDFGSNAVDGFMNTYDAGKTLYETIVTNNNATTEYSQSLDELRRKGVKAFSEINAEGNKVKKNLGDGIDTGGDSEESTDTGSSDFTQTGTIFEGFVQKSEEQGKKGGEAFARQFNGNLNSIDLMSPTEEAMQAQADYISEMNAEQLAKWIKIQNRKSEIRRAKHEERIEFNKMWGQRLFEQNATEMEMLIKKKEKAIAEAEEKNAATWAIEQFYNNKIDALEAENNQKSIERFNQRFSFIKDGFANTFSAIFKGTKSVTEAFGDMWSSIIDKVIDKLAEMAAHKVFGFVTGGGGGGFLEVGDFFGGVFHNGGTVPGPIGQERLILAQAGETVSPIGSNSGSGSGGYSTANISVNLDGRTIAQAVKQPLVDTIRITGGARF